MQLYVNTYGTYVHIKDQMFEIRVPVEGKNSEYTKHHYAAHKVKSIVLPKAVALSSDAVILALKHNVDIIFVDFDGRPLGRVWHSKLGSTTKIRKCQLKISVDERGLEYTKKWIGQKLENQINFIQDLKKHRAKKAEWLDDKIQAIAHLAGEIYKQEGSCVADVAETIRGLEGSAGRHYFEVLSKTLSKEYQFNGRSARPASDPFNAFLNYAYGMLYSKVEKSLIIAGVDPYLGFMHRDDYNQLSMVYDYIESYRVIAEKVVFRLFSAKKVNQKHTDKITNGYSLNEEGKRLLVEHFNKYFEEDTMRYKGRNQTRANALQQDTHQFANEMITANQLE